MINAKGKSVAFTLYYYCRVFAQHDSRESIVVHICHLSHPTLLGAR